ncbi:hypothetical protein [Persephonella sp.]|nr:hypothetical protein [Persephonella sp.]
MFRNLLLILIIPFFAAAGITKGEIEFRSEKDFFNKSENVCFYLKNNSEEDIYLPSSAPWAVFEDKQFEKVVFSPVATQSIVKIKPHQSKKWCWEQKDFKNEQVPSGEYTIRLTVFKKGKRIFLTSMVKINNSMK